MNIKYSNKFIPGSGVCSQVTWNNIDLKKALEKCFGVQKGESISGLEITEHGIIAHFERKDSSA